MAVIYKLYHIVVRGDDESYEKLGIYSSGVLARIELERLAALPEFKVPGGRLMVDAGEFDFVWWSSGFGQGDDFEPANRNLRTVPRLVVKPLERPFEHIDGAVEIFTLRHTIVRADDDIDHKEIGIFSSEALAKRAMERVADKPGFRDPRGHFTIEPSLLDVCSR